MKKKDKQKKLLKALIEIPSPSGFEEKIAKYIKKELLQYLPRTRVEIDFQNNVIATIKGTSDKVIMIDAHLDQIGYIVNNIDREGIINVQQIGGLDNSIISARQLIILTDKGKINAVVDRKHAHLVADEDDEAIEDMSEAYIDIGIRKRKQVQKVVKIGDPVVFKPSFFPLREDYFSGYGFDDKAGCFILMEAIKEIVRSKRKPIPTLIFTFSAQEETGGTKAMPLVLKYNPDIFIEVDVTFATDYLDYKDMERLVGKCDLGKGIVLYRGVDIDKYILKLTESIARRNKIKFQYQASTGRNGYISDEMTCYGNKVIVVGIPLRNMHTPVETVNLKDLNYGISLLKHLLLNAKLKRVL